MELCGTVEKKYTNQFLFLYFVLVSDSKDYCGINGASVRVQIPCGSWIR
jgi:hypothetical protein